MQLKPKMRAGKLIKKGGVGFEPLTPWLLEIDNS
jgi:hypothetical protein